MLRERALRLAGTLNPGTRETLLARHQILYKIRFLSVRLALLETASAFFVLRHPKCESLRPVLTHLRSVGSYF